MRKEVLFLIWSPPLALLMFVYFAMESLALLQYERVLSFAFFLLACIALVAFIILQKQLYELLTLYSPKPPGSRKSIPRPQAGVFDTRRKQSLRRVFVHLSFMQHCV